MPGVVQTSLGPLWWSIKKEILLKGVITHICSQGFPNTSFSPLFQTTLGDNFHNSSRWDAAAQSWCWGRTWITQSQESMTWYHVLAAYESCLCSPFTRAIISMISLFPMAQVCPGGWDPPACSGRAAHRMPWRCSKMTSWWLTQEPGQINSFRSFWSGCVLHPHPSPASMASR